MMSAARPALGLNWQLVKDWNEKARYQQKTEAQARELYRAVTDIADGVLRHRVCGSQASGLVRHVLERITGAPLGGEQAEAPGP